MGPSALAGALPLLLLAACTHDADVHGTVGKSGKGVPGVTVTIDCPGVAERTTTTNATGDFRFEGLGSGIGDACTVEAKSPETWAGAQTVAGRCATHDAKSGLCTEAMFAFELRQ